MERGAESPNFRSSYFLQRSTVSWSRQCMEQKTNASTKRSILFPAKNRICTSRNTLESSIWKVCFLASASSRNFQKLGRRPSTTRWRRTPCSTCGTGRPLRMTTAVTIISIAHSSLKVHEHSKLPNLVAQYQQNETLIFRRRR